MFSEPMVTQLINDPEHWRRRAIEARRIAQSLNDHAAKETMQEIARSYERIAEIAERKAIDGAGAR